MIAVGALRDRRVHAHGRAVAAALGRMVMATTDYLRIDVFVWWTRGRLELSRTITMRHAQTRGTAHGGVESARPGGAFVVY